MKKDSKQRLFEMMGKVDTSFKKKLNENYYDAVDGGMNSYAADNTDFGDESNNKPTGDPTKEDMVNHLQSKFQGMGSAEEMKFAIESAIYWYAHDYHGGQHSNLYSVLSTSQYKPSPMERSIKDTDDYLAIQMYDTLESDIGGAIDRSGLGESNVNEMLNEVSSNSPINKFVMFGFNFPSVDFIDDVWSDDPNLAKHLKDKFMGYYDKYGSHAVMSMFYANLSGGNQRKLEDWIINNYSG